MSERVGGKVGRRRSGGTAGVVLAHVRRVVHAIHAQSTAIEATLGLTGPQLWALRELDLCEASQPVGFLARRLVIHKASAGRLVERLEDKGLVQREADAEDGRVVRVALTARGRTLARRSTQGPAQADLLTQLETLEARDLEAIARALERVVRLLGATSVAALPLFEESPATARRAPREPHARRDRPRPASPSTSRPRAR